MIGIARDNLEDLNSKLNEAAGSDLIITSAGVSKGDYDIVKDVLTQRGDMNFWSVRMRPAKPLAFGHLKVEGIRSIPLLGLPGNPVSAMVAFECSPAPPSSPCWAGATCPRPTVDGVLTGPIHNYDGRRVYARVQVARKDGAYYATPTGPSRLQHPYVHGPSQRAGHLPGGPSLQEYRGTSKADNAGLERRG